MSTAYRCDRCGEIVKHPFNVDEHMPTPCDGNAWAVRFYVNRIDARGPQVAHLHRECWLALVAEMLNENGPLPQADDTP